MHFNLEESLWVLASSDLNLPILITKNQEVALGTGVDEPAQVLPGYGNGFDGPGIVEVAQVEVALEEALRDYVEPASAVIAEVSGKDRFRVPVFFLLLLFLREFASKSHTSLLFFLFFVLLLVLLHLELHHFDFPASNGDYISQKCLRVVNVLGSRSADFIDIAIGAANKELRRI